MIEIKYTGIYKGIQFKEILVVKYQKDACKIWGVTPYHIKTWCYIGEPKTELAIKNPYVKIAMFEHSGEAGYFVPKNKIGIPMKRIDLVTIINNHRTICSHYGATMDWYNKNSPDLQ